MESQKLLRETEAAEILNVKPATLQQWRHQGRGPRFKKFSRNVRYTVADLMAFVEGETHHRPAV